MSKRISLAGLLLVMSGCLIQNLSPETRLRDSVIELNEGARWGRMDVAAGHVSPLFQNQFKLSHVRWGRDIQIADSEILAVSAHTEEDGTGAVSRVAVRWYDHETMVIEQTTVRQAWIKHKQTFLLTAESVESGHPGLLAIPTIQQPIQGPAQPQEYENFDDAQWSSAY